MATDGERTGDKGGWPAPLRCAQCRREVPPDLALHPEGQDYTVAFCSAGCHALWCAAPVKPRAAGRGWQPRDRPAGDAE